MEVPLIAPSAISNASATDAHELTAPMSRLPSSLSTAFHIVPASRDSICHVPLIADCGAIGVWSVVPIRVLKPTIPATKTMRIIGRSSNTGL
jgi:hypothetical protein